MKEKLPEKFPEKFLEKLKEKGIKLDNVKKNYELNKTKIDEYSKRMKKHLEYEKEVLK